ncbi:hypothetical protein GGI15_003683 [Coemansia interrupta]|uniref:Uncharacterized protein n=1 Tax=Coemansia interrupta TaxID=1126814 RepID=A0A9W8H9R5_9FUNG|nr:hypothetical protein GGI15_003683 [Coemansia interrupta]
MHRADSSGSSGERQESTTEPDDLPTYEETVSFRKRYVLRYPQVLSRTVHAVDSDLGRTAFLKRTHGLSTSRSTYYMVGGGGNGGVGEEREVWRCRRERQGFELVFTAAGRSADDDDGDGDEREAVVQEEEEEAVEEEEMADTGAVDDIIGTTQALLDSKPGDMAAPEATAPPRQLPPPPAYAESEEHHATLCPSPTVILHAPSPMPFIYDFELRSHGRDGRLRWQHGEAAKGAAEFCCVERASGRVLAEIVQEAGGLGTLVLHGRDLPMEVHGFLVVSAIAVAEEYPVRQVAMLN